MSIRRSKASKNKKKKFFTTPNNKRKNAIIGGTVGGAGALGLGVYLASKKNQIDAFAETVVRDFEDAIDDIIVDPVEDVVDDVEDIVTEPIIDEPINYGQDIIEDVTDAVNNTTAEQSDSIDIVEKQTGTIDDTVIDEQAQDYADYVNEEIADPVEDVVDDVKDTVDDAVNFIEDEIIEPTLKAINVVGDTASEPIEEIDEQAQDYAEEDNYVDETIDYIKEEIIEPVIETFEQLPEAIKTVEEEYIAPIIEIVEEVIVEPVIETFEQLPEEIRTVEEKYIAPVIETVQEVIIEPVVRTTETLVYPTSTYFARSKKKQPTIMVSSEKELEAIKKVIDKKAKKFADGVSTKVTKFRLDMTKIGKGIGTIDITKPKKKVKKRQSEGYKSKNLKNISDNVFSLGLSAISISQGGASVGGAVGSSRDLVAIDQKLKPANERTESAEEFMSKGKRKK